MGVQRTSSVFLAGCAAYALIAACSSDETVPPGATGTASGSGAASTSTSTGGASTTTSSSSASGGRGGSGTGGAGAGGMGPGGMGVGAVGGMGVGGMGVGAVGGVGGMGVGAVGGMGVGAVGGTGVGGMGVGGGGSGGGTTSSGTRLKRMFLQGNDGTDDLTRTYVAWPIPNSPYPYGRYETQWWDSLRQEECAYQIAADGQVRCLPTDTASLVLYFASPCTQPAVAIQPAPPACPQDIPKYAATTDPAACSPGGGGVVHIAPVGAYLGASSCYFSGPGCSSGCSNITYLFYAVGAEVPASSFVAGAMQNDP